MSNISARRGSSGRTDEASAVHEVVKKEGKRVLLISYFFPPLGGAGVQRNLKFVKFLPEFGWTPHVLTVKQVKYHAYDHTLLGDIPAIARIVRTESADPLRLAGLAQSLIQRFRPSTAATGNVAVESFTQRTYRAVRDWAAFPDFHVGWIPFVHRAGLREITNHSDIRVILARSVPFSSCLAAHWLSRATGLPYVLDFADGWTDDPHLRAPTRFHRRAHAVLERRMVGGADMVTVYSESLKGQFEKRYPWLQGRVHCLPNGYDPDDKSGLEASHSRPHQRRLVYMGTLYEHQEENFRSFLHALALLPKELVARMEINFVGQHYPQAKALVRDFSLDNCIHFRGYVPHGEALQHLSSADAGLLFIRAGDRTMITGKVFEYLMTGVPVLASIEPDGECAEILRATGHGQWITEPHDSSGMARAIESLAARGWKRPNHPGVQQFDRRVVTSKLASVLDQAVERRHPHRASNHG